MSTGSFFTGIWVTILVAVFLLSVYGLEQPAIIVSAIVGTVTSFLIGVAKGHEE